VSDVAARLRAIQASAPTSDGVACFARLYADVTEGVAARLATQTFAAPAFLATLDVHFADLFFAALDDGPAKVPRSWAPLFAARGRKGIEPLQFALAGMNAHINRDLPVALVGTWTELGRSPAQHADYTLVNRVLDQVEAQVKARFVAGQLSWIDRILHRTHRLDDVLAMWNVANARAAAWTNGEALWSLRSDPKLSASFLDTLDRSVGFAGRGLLLPL
jgi:hypothetical protein